MVSTRPAVQTSEVRDGASEFVARVGTQIARIGSRRDKLYSCILGRCVHVKSWRPLSFNLMNVCSEGAHILRAQVLQILQLGRSLRQPPSSRRSSNVLKFHSQWREEMGPYWIPLHVSSTLRAKRCTVGMIRIHGVNCIRRCFVHSTSLLLSSFLPPMKERRHSPITGLQCD